MKYVDAGYSIRFIKSAKSDFKNKERNNQLYLIGCLKNAVKSYLNCFIGLAMSMM